MRRLDLTDRRFGHLTVIGPGQSAELNSNGKPRTAWLCRCDCGNRVTVTTQKLRQGRKTSCGCQTLNKVGLPRKRIEHHGDSTRTSRIYRIWSGMLMRCGYHSGSEPRVRDRYEGRGIRVCREWRESYVAFRDWALSHGYRDDLSIDRVDNDGNYEPGNCRWADAYTQTHNRGLTIAVSTVRRLDEMTLEDANASGDMLTRLEALAGRLAVEIDASDGGHGFGVICREYRQTVEAIEAIRKTGERPKGIDDLVSGKPGPDLRRLSVV